MTSRWLIPVTAFSLLLSGCFPPSSQQHLVDRESDDGTVVAATQYEWKLVTSWPKNFPGLGMAPEKFAVLVNEMSQGRLQVTVYGANQLVPGFQVFDAVSSGSVEMGHSAAYYWKGKVPAAQFFTSIPFGLTAQEMNGYLHHGGGLALWEELYAPFDLLPMAGGNTGVQMGGWFNKEINSVDDLKGLKMRLPGIGGEVLQRLGGVPVSLPGGELFTALQTGAIDATEWVGPSNDLAFGFNEAAEYYYYPGWHEPGSSLEFLINKAAFDALPNDLQVIVRAAARVVNHDMLDEYTVRNIIALQTLQEKGVKIRRFPDEVLNALQQVTDQVMAEQAAADADIARIYTHFQHYTQGVRAYHAITEKAYLEVHYP
ncbi:MULTISPECIES: TRAP transporter substrate-binding protein [Corallincola]|uniref:ABC transporter substrate-binding protein n=2 Tax=Corallincola TaxID=1775176 RepID=A0ABY1WSP5_9GAMM|nr:MULTISPECIES: TRAP transporter substrate-binding protein DctP [Corallincola]TAA47554.1 ABC transporter substrate-binding protein [Corallincola spongiicola]TCI05236.1 ABC transporter substrate-binding protein [Corallincola luteus]